jgi:hypothetical protein
MSKTTDIQIIEPTTPAVLGQPAFQPRPHMIIWLDVAIELQSDSPTDIETACKEAGTPVSRRSWYEWRKEPGFQEWFDEQWTLKRKYWKHSLDAIGMKYAKRGDYNFWRDMKKTVGDDPEANTEQGEFTYSWKKRV